MKRFILSIILLQSMCVHQVVLASDGTLDTTFSGDGRAVINFDGTDAEARALVVRYDGIIVAAGSVATAGGSNFGVQRINPDGTPIGSGTQTNIGDNDMITGLAVQPDNKVIAVGISQGSATSDFIIARYTSDGTLDTTFNKDGATPGIQNVDFFGAQMAEALAIALKSDGRIVAVGRAQDTSLDANVNLFYAVAVLNEDGTLDSSFAGGMGRRVYSNITPAGGVLNVSSGAQAVAIQRLNGTENVVLAGFGEQAGNDPLRFQIVRITCDGNLDLSFNNNGVDQVVFTADVDEAATGIDVLPDGRIIAVGSSLLLTDSEIVLTRRLANGGPDISFGLDGEFTFNPLGFGNSFMASALNIQNDQKIVIAGNVLNDDNPALVARILADGSSEDTSFTDGNTDGFVLTSFSDDATFSSARAVALQEDGKIVVAGRNTAADLTSFGLARYLNNNSNEVVIIAPTVTQPTSLGNCNDPRPVVKGRAQNPSNVAVFVNGALVDRTTTIDATNEWLYLPNAPLPEGKVTFQVVAEYQSGNMNMISDPVCCGVCLGPLACIAQAVREKYCSCIDALVS